MQPVGFGMTQRQQLVAFNAAANLDLPAAARPKVLALRGGKGAAQGGVHAADTGRSGARLVRLSLRDGAQERSDVAGSQVP